MADVMKQHGAFSWNELMTTDIEGAKTFYSKLFGWTMQEFPNGNVPYTMAKANDTDVAGMMAMPPEGPAMPSYWGGYVTVDDVEASAKEAENLGGKILMPPTDIPDVGRFCVIQDPQGAVLSIITYSAKC